MRHPSIRFLLSAVGLSLVVAATAASAQQPPIRIRGTIEKVEGPIYVVKSRDGAELKLTLSEKGTVRGLVKGSIADVKVGSYIGISAMPQPDGSQHAIHIHIFPETMRGTGEGFRPWDNQPGSTMTNATVDTTIAGVDGHVIMVKYKDGEKKIIVPPTTPIVIYVPGHKDELKPGAKIMIPGATKKDDGTLEAGNVNVGRDGLTPPM